MSELIIRDCSPRDGLQPLDPIKPSQRAALVRRLEGAGLGRIEIASFVSPSAVPAMAEAAAVLAELGPSDAYWVLVPNRRGAELALEAGASQLTVTVSASEGYSEKNTQRSITESLGAFAEIRTTAPDAILDVVISCCFGSPFEPIRPSDVASLVRQLTELGADLCTLADTTGTATPARLAEVLALTGTDHGLHLHDSRGTALVNAYAGFQAGVRRFDTSLGGLGGSPFAPGAGGNLATEDLVLLMEDLGIDTGVALDELLGGQSMARRRALGGHAQPGLSGRSARGACAMSGLVHAQTSRGITTLTLDSPANRNALSNQLLEELGAGIEAARADPDVRALVLTGTGTVFCSGADLSTPGSVASAPVTLVDVLEMLTQFPKATMVVLNGHVRAGGIGLVAAVDVVVAPPQATFAFSEVRLGVSPAIISVVATRVMAPRAVSRYMLSGEVFDAKVALEAGLVSVVADDAALENVVSELSAALSLGEPRAVLETKALLRALPTLSSKEGFARAEALSAELFATDEAKAGIAALKAKQPPPWAPDPAT